MLAIFARTNPKLILSYWGHFCIVRILWPVHITWKDFLKHSFRFVSFSFRLSVRVAGCCRFPLRGCGAYWGQIQFTQWALTLDELPAHRRTLTDGICTSGATLGFSILLKDTLTCSSVPPRGAGIRTGDPLITWSPCQLPYQPSLLFSLSLWPSDHQSTSSTHWATAANVSICFFNLSFMTRYDSFWGFGLTLTLGFCKLWTIGQLIYISNNH